jgi:cytochrome P450
MDAMLHPRILPEVSVPDRIRMLLRFPRDPLGTLGWLSDRYGDVVSIRIPGGHQAVLLRRPEHVEHVLMAPRGTYSKRHPAGEELRRVVGEGLLTSEDPLWRRQRLLIQPSFHRRSLANFVSTMQRVAQDTVDTLLQAAERHEEIDLFEVMQQELLRVLGLTLLSVDLTSRANRLCQAVTLVEKDVSRRIYPGFKLPPWLTPWRDHAFARAMTLLDEEILKIIAMRRLHGEDAPQDDFLGLLLAAATEDDGERMSDRQLRDEIMTFFIAGHETTAKALSWCFLSLSDHPEVENAVRIELAEIVQGRAVTIDDLPKLDLTRRVVKETLRLYPPAPITSGRRAECEDIVGGFRIPAGSLIVLSPYLIQRDSRYWRNPDTFDPSRFLPGQAEAGLPRGAYLPFMDGPRRCIGEQFALMEMEIFLATILPRVHFHRNPARRVPAKVSGALRPNGLWLRPEAIAARSAAPHDSYHPV